MNSPSYRKILLKQYLSVFKNLHGDNKKRQRADLEKNINFFRHNYLNLLPLKKDVAILEIGPGMGQFQVFLKREGYVHVRGIDGSEEIAQYCKANDLHVSYEENFIDFFNQEENKNTLDLIIANDILEHFTKQELVDLLGAMKGALRDGGAIIAKVPNASACFVATNNRYGDFTHELMFTEFSLQQLCGALGFSRIEFFAPNLFCFYYNPLNYIGLSLNFLLKLIQIGIHRLNGNFDVNIVTNNIIFKLYK
ncbi:class I SAM-dependent methyltransferase [Patescibacteria group bacterium]|nr:class I SAM-dependent methyltransferase [Patescibacteria group bacterium]